MRKLFAVLGVLFLMGLVSAGIPIPICTKHKTDSSLTDWGLDALKNNASWGINSTWLPNAGVYFTIEDNYNPKYASGANLPGVHIQGVGNSYTFYDEPKVIDKWGDLVAEPYGHENFDIEAFYFDQDVNCTYITIITSQPPTETGDSAPGDLAMNLDNNINTGKWGYEYGVKLESYHAPSLNVFGLYSNPDWQEPPYVPENRPSYFTSGTYIGQVTGVYTELLDGSGNGVYDDGYPNYVIQLAIPKSMVGQPNDVNIHEFHMSEYCGNDHVPAAPEFPLILVPITITGLATLLAYHFSKRAS